MLSEQVRRLTTITCLRVEYRAEGVMPITALTGAAPHSGVCGSVRGLTTRRWLGKSVEGLSFVYRQLQLRLLVYLGADGRGSPKYPAITT